MLAAAAIGLLGGNYFVSQAMRVGEVSVTAPFRYTVVLWAMAISWLVFSEAPTLRALIGVGIVVALGLYTLRRERVRDQTVSARQGCAAARNRAAGPSRSRQICASSSNQMMAADRLAVGEYAVAAPGERRPQT